MAETQPKFKQICVGQYTPKMGGQSFVVIGLSEEGQVYQFKTGRWQKIDDLPKPPTGKAAPGEDSTW